MPISLLVASSDDHFREMVRENILNMPNAKVIAEYPEVGSNLYIRVLQDLERHPEAALFVDVAGDPEAGLKAVEKVRQAAPELYVVTANYAADAESVIHAVRSGANDFLTLPLRRTEFKEAMQRLERTPRRAASGASRLGKVYSFLGVKGGVGTTTLASNFAAVLAQRKQQTVLLDIDWTANDIALQIGASPQHSLVDVGENLARMDQSLFEGFVARDPLGFFYVGPPDSMEHRGYFTETMLREFTTFLVEKYEAIVIDAGRDVANELTLSALQSSSSIFLVMQQDYPSIRDAQRFVSYLMRMGFSQDQIRIVVNGYQKKPASNMASLDQIKQTLNREVFYGIPSSPAVLAAVNRARPFVEDRVAAGDLDRVFRAFVDKATGRAKEEIAKSA
jgi:pilus assembly protein CpaE